MGTPTLKRAGAAWKRADAEREYWQSHFSDLLEKYPDQFVAVYKGEVVAAAPEIQQLVTLLEQKELRITDVSVRFLTRDPRRVLL